MQLQKELAINLNDIKIEQSLTSYDVRSSNYMCLLLADLSSRVWISDQHVPAMSVDGDGTSIKHSNARIYSFKLVLFSCTPTMRKA